MDSDTPPETAAPDRDIVAWPRISIITPSYNQGQFLEATVRSVMEQGYPNLEYIIMDGGSTDHSLDIIKQYADFVTYWASEKDEGQTHAINKGFERSSGDILGWLNSDDTYLPGALTTVAKAFMEADEKVGAVVGSGYRVDTQGNILVERHMTTIDYEHILMWTRPEYFCQPSCLFTRKAWEKCGPLDQSLHYSMDLALWLNIAQHFDYLRIDQPLSNTTVHPDAKTMSKASYSLIDTAILLMRHGREDLARFQLNKLARRLEKAQHGDESKRRWLRRVKRRLQRKFFS